MPRDVELAIVNQGLQCNGYINMQRLGVLVWLPKSIKSLRRSPNLEYRIRMRSEKEHRGNVTSSQAFCLHVSFRCVFQKRSRFPKLSVRSRLLVIEHFAQCSEIARRHSADERRRIGRKQGLTRHVALGGGASEHSDSPIRMPAVHRARAELNSWDREIGMESRCSK
jgi:hypothetical protein